MTNIKLYFLVAILFATIEARAQVGIGTTNPRATLDVQLPATYQTGDLAGVAIPQLTAQQIIGMVTTNLKPGTLVYSSTILDPISDKGYWYFTGSIWSQIGGVNSNIYESDGAINSNRTLTLNNNNLVFDRLSGTGKVAVNATFETNGAVFNKKIVTINGNYTVSSDDCVIISNSISEVTLTMPAVNLNIGRVITIININPNYDNVVFPLGTVNPFMSNTYVGSTLSASFISDGQYWYALNQ